MQRRLICRRLVALAVAYAIALNAVLSLLPAFAPAAEAGATTLALMCGTGHSGQRPAADLPSNGRGPDCPFGLMCAALGCAAAGGLAVGARGDVVLAPASTTLLNFVRRDDPALRRRDTGTPFARAPPPA